MRFRWNQWAALATFAAVIWAYFIFPLRGGFSDAMLGTSLFPHDAMLNAGILEWGRRALGSSSLHVFEWPAGFPLHNTLANTENLLGWQPEYAFLRWMGFTVTFAYNALIVTSFFLSAAGAGLLAARLGANGGGAFLAGLIFAFTPFHLVHVIHLQTLSVCWVPFAVYIGSCPVARRWTWRRSPDRSSFVRCLGCTSDYSWPSRCPSMQAWRSPRAALRFAAADCWRSLAQAWERERRCGRLPITTLPTPGATGTRIR